MKKCKNCKYWNDKRLKCTHELSGRPESSVCIDWTTKEGKGRYDPYKRKTG